METETTKEPVVDSGRKTTTSKTMNITMDNQTKDEYKHYESVSEEEMEEEQFHDVQNPNQDRDANTELGNAHEMNIVDT